MKVLVVDDEPSILMSLEFLMRKNNYEVFIARDGKEAIEILNAEQPQVIVLDIMMPEVDGYEVCEYIRKTEALSKMGVIFLSAKSKESDLEKAFQLGADRYISKPFATKNLLVQIQELIEEKELRAI
ncbi:MAG: response regulator [Cyclobacteriaceae bacterium]|nr:response regulator [Cyclobacteriaceae bacterium]MCH8515774.1 response regulator [Cyclobacteriaceae bacterium]